MPDCVALLRGINVGGRSILPMERLRRVVEGLGYDDVRTHLASGNVLFRTDEEDGDETATRIRSALQHELDRDLAVMVRTAEDLRAVTTVDPFPDADASRLHVAFLSARASAKASRALLGLFDDQPERAVVQGREVFIDYVNGAGRSKIDLKRLERAAGLEATARNWRTVNALLQKLTA